MAAVSLPTIPVLMLPVAAGPSPALPALPPPGAPPLLWPLRAGAAPPAPGSEAALDRHEAARRARFARRREMDRYTAAHFGLRRLLGGYLHQTRVRW